MKESDILIEKIEKFRKEHIRLPISFKELGIEEIGSPILLFILPCQ